MKPWMKRSLAIVSLISLFGTIASPVGLAKSYQSPHHIAQQFGLEDLTPPDYLNDNTYDNQQSEDEVLFDETNPDAYPEDDELICQDGDTPDDEPICGTASDWAEQNNVDNTDASDDENPFIIDDQTTDDQSTIEQDTMDQMLGLIESSKSLDSDQIISRLLKHNLSVDQIIEFFSYLSDDSDTSTDVTDEDVSSYSDALMANLVNSTMDQQALFSLLEQLSAVYEKIGNYDNVIKVQKHVLQSNPAYTDAYDRLSDAYLQVGDTSFKLFVNGVQTDLDTDPVVVNGRNLLPFRPISESLNANVNWDPAAQAVTMQRDGQVVRLIIGQRTAFINNKPVKLDAPAQVKNGHTVVPVRFIGESLNSEVQWKPASHALIILDKNA